MYKAYENQHKNVEKYTKLVAQYGPYRFFATLSFQHLISEQQAVASASKLIIRLHKKLLGIDWQSGDGFSCLTGVAVLEKASIRKKVHGATYNIKDRSNCHFHFLLRNHPAISPDPSLGLRRLSRAWEEVARGLNYKQTRKLVGINGTDVQLVATDGVIGYLLKEARDWAWKDRERLFLLDGEGLIPIDLSRLKLGD